MLAEQILEYAHKLDNPLSQVNQPEVDSLIAIEAKSTTVTLRQVINYLEDVAASGTFTKRLRARLRPEGINPLESLIQVNKAHYNYSEPDGVESGSKH